MSIEPRGRSASGPRGETLVALFMELAGISSPPGAERRVADRVIDELKRIGLAWGEDGAAAELGGDTGNVVAWIPATNEAAAPLFFCAHLDTVPEPDPIVPVVEAGVIKSGGDTILGADNKAAVATLLAAAAIISDERPAHGGIELVFTPMEEVGCLGANVFDSTALGARCGFVYDHAGPIGEYVSSAPSGTRLEFEFVGRAAHAGIDPDAGRSAIVAAAEAIGRIPAGRTAGGATVNVGIVAGGTAHNVVPERCKFTVDLRARSGEQADALVAEVVSTCNQVATAHECELGTAVFEKYSAYHFEPDAPVVALASAAFARVGLEAKPVEGGGGADASIFNARGLPCLNLANGMSAIHTENEHIAVADLALMLELTLAIVGESVLLGRGQGTPAAFSRSRRCEARPSSRS